VNIATELMLNKNAPPAFTPGIFTRQLQHYTENPQGQKRGKKGDRAKKGTGQKRGQIYY
jgi:hypothetical protein